MRHLLHARASVHKDATPIAAPKAAPTGCGLCIQAEIPLFQLQASVEQRGRDFQQGIAFRRPYEVLLLCTPLPNHHQAAAGERADSKLHEHEQPDQSGAALPLLPQHLVFASVPGAHSRKPHLGRLLQRHLPPSITCLEVWPPHAPHGLWPVTSLKTRGRRACAIVS